MTEPLLEIANVKTVIPSYSWDDGVPERDFNDFLALKEDLSASSTNTSGVEYVGWAPFMKVDVHSELSQEDIDLDPLVAERTIDFGDYYNSGSNTLKSFSTDKISFCHNYIMPGLYTIKLLKKLYVLVNPLDIGKDTDPWDTDDGGGGGGGGGGNDDDGLRCYGKHCVEWQWRARDCYNLQYWLPDDEVITWAMTDCVSGTKPKRWAYEPCVDSLISNDPGTYIQRNEKRFPFANQWHNFLCDGQSNVKNDAITWQESIFQGSDQLTWGSISGPCLNLRVADMIWKWDFTKCSTDSVNNTPLTWDETKCNQYMKKTWDEAITSGPSNSISCEERTPSLSAGETIVEKELVIRVKEIMPEAYIDVCQPVEPEKRTSPLTVRLSPRFSRPGSFPIEKIVWDLGDGSPLLEQKRWATDASPPFVYSGVIQNDFSDPRNYDVVYTYNKTVSSGFSFYPSLTVYAANTYSGDCAAAVVGPIVPQKYDKKASGLKLIQNEITDHSVVLLGEIDNSSALWVLKNSYLPEIKASNRIRLNANFRSGSIAVDYRAVATYPLDQDIAIGFVQYLYTTTGLISSAVRIPIEKYETTGVASFSVNQNYNTLVLPFSASTAEVTSDNVSDTFEYTTELMSYTYEPLFVPTPTPSLTPTPTPTPTPVKEAVLLEDLSGYVSTEDSTGKVLTENV